jgi:hypothetical protein
MVRLGWVMGTWWASIGGRNSAPIPNDRTSREDMKLIDVDDGSNYKYKSNIYVVCYKKRS